MSNLEGFINQQEDKLETIIKGLSNFKKSPKDRLTNAYLATRSEMIEKDWNWFCKTHNNILAAIKKDEREACGYFQKGIYSQYEEAFCDYKTRIKAELEKKKEIPGSSSTNDSVVNRNAEIKLPRIQIPVFSGSYDNWSSFHDMFVSVIHNNSNLDAVQKLNYLKCNLKGEPEMLLRNLSTTASNYEEAWKMLKNRYENKRFNLNEIFKHLLSLKIVNPGSSQDLKRILDTTSSCLKALNNIGVSTDTWDPIIVYLTLSRVDIETRKEWETRIDREAAQQLPSWKQLTEFLETRFRSLEMMESSRVINRSSIARNRSFHTMSREGNNSNFRTCLLCSNQHYLFQCPVFCSEYDPMKRTEFAKTKRLCFNCLASTHQVKQCRNKVNCRECNRRHHTLLHYGGNNQQEATSSEENQQQSGSAQENQRHQEEENRVSANFVSRKCMSESVILATALVHAKSQCGENYVLRSLMDQGSQSSFITEATVQLLGLRKIPVNGIVSGVGNNETRTTNMVYLNLQSIYNPKFKLLVKAFILNSLTNFLPQTKFTKDSWVQLKGLSLADPNYGTPSKIDLILGAEVYSESIREGLIKESTKGGLIAQNTEFGWIVSGRLEANCNHHSKITINCHLQIKEDDILKKFWQMENEPDMLQKKMTKEELLCEELYDRTTKRDTEGRYVVKLPINKEDPECLYGKSRIIAMKRYELLERKLMKNQSIYHNYQNVLKEYLTLNHMTLITDENELRENQSVYLPHHAVIKEDSETTKTRVVFDASCKGMNNISLNDNLMVGPRLQPELRHLLMRWRTHPICIISDIVKMYRMVRLMDADTKFQRILWRPNQHEPIQDYKLLTLTFGTACAPYLAVKSLQRLANDEGVNFPRAALITQNDFYVDDLMTGCEDEEEAIQIYHEMTELMKSGGFKLQKWCSSNDNLLKHIYKDNIHTSKIENLIRIKNDDSVKVLGVQWNRNTDSFGYTIQIPEEEGFITKRKVLSTIARLYDPIGWIAPVILTAKLFMQKLWKAGIRWDDELNEELSSEWSKFKFNLLQLEKLSIPRWIGIHKSTCHKELHAFADASKRAYAAVIYLRVIDETGKINIHLITSKTKVAPIEKEISIPRLELCAARLASKLIFEVSQVMGIEKKNLHAWSDSMVVLAWLRGSPDRWTTFVSNRVSEILTILEFDQWNYINTSVNPADCASRGVQSANELNTFWWKGPEFLQEKIFHSNEIEYVTHEDERKIKAFVVTNQPKDQLWDKFSNLSRLLRVLSYCRRFLLRKSRMGNLGKSIKVEEMQESLMICIRHLQGEEFQEEIKFLKMGRNIPKKSLLYNLNPIIGKDELVRVGGRINLSQVDYGQKHPIIVPPDSHLTTLIIRDAHAKTLHGGPQLMLSVLRTNYWIIRGRNQVKKCYRNCTTCIRYSRIKNNPIMGQLPEVRLKPNRPFASSGVDFAGPVNIKFSPGRGSKVYKGYICLFVCMVTRAIHLEAVSNLSAKGFIAAFRRFISRRGHCQDLYSDNGTNFVGANKELEEMFESAVKSLPEELSALLSLERTRWHFNPPLSPNFGGLWEAGIKSTKFHLKRVIGNTNLTFEELSTVLSQIEACLNSRPLTELTDDPFDQVPLTPAHFLIGEPFINLIEEDVTETQLTNLERWKFMRKIVGDFWKRWSKEYLVTLNQKFKWIKETSEPEVDDVVVIRDDHLPPARWLLGKILEKHTGKDGVTRVVTIKCKNSNLKRPVSKIIIFPRK